MTAARTAPLARRGLFGFSAALATSLALTACGFALRQAPELQFQSVQFTGFDANSPLAKELRQNIEASPGTRVVDSAGQAQVVLEALADTRDRAVVGSTATGLVREFELRMRFEFKLRTPGGRELIAPTELTQVRDLSYNEGVALAKQYESASQFKAMQSDIVSQVMRRLAAVPKP
ncbi:MAG: LPS assembly lipoprotein LptE [Burkholderiales bacterium]